MTDNAQDIKNDNISESDGEPTEAAQVLYGDRARAEHYDQPEDTDKVTLDADTIVAKRPLPASTDNPEA